MEEAATTNLYLHSGAILNVQIREATIHSPRSYLFPQAQDGNMSSRQAIFGFIAAALINFLQLMYQGKPESPFQTRPLIMFIAVVSLLMYCLSYDTKLRFYTGDHYDTRALMARFVHISMAIFGPLSLAAMSSVLFPQFPCAFLFLAAIFYSFCRFPLPAIKRTWDWLQIAIKNRFCRQQHQQGSRRRAAGRVTVRVPWLSLSGHAFSIDQVQIGIRPPV